MGRPERTLRPSTAGIERMMDTDNGYGYDDSIKSGIHTNPEYSGGAYGGGYANIGK